MCFTACAHCSCFQRCYGIHRNVGAHVTRVKVLSLDSFLIAEVDLLECVAFSCASSDPAGTSDYGRRVGNQNARLIYEACAAPTDRPSPHATDTEV